MIAIRVRHGRRQLIAEVFYRLWGRLRDESVGEFYSTDFIWDAIEEKIAREHADEYKEIENIKKMTNKEVSEAMKKLRSVRNHRLRTATKELST